MSWLRCLLGLWLVACYFALGAGGGFAGELGRSFTLLGKGELLFWLAHGLLLLPGLFLLFFGWPSGAANVAGGLLRLAPLLSGKAPRFFGWGLLLVLVAAVGIRFGRSALLEDLPITGDEHMVLFGARTVAAGEFSVPKYDEGLGFTTRYLYEKAGRVSAMDFPGTIFFRALGLRLGTGPWLFALLAAVSFWALVQAIALHEGRAGALWAAAAWLLSPMVLALSFTEHAHLLSRSLVALGWALYLRILAGAGEGASHRFQNLLHAGVAGSFAAAFLARPAEAAMSFLPIFLALAWRALKSREVRRLVFLVLPALAGPGLMLLYNQVLTGSPLVSPRVLGTVLLVKPSLLLFWERLGNNSLFNAVLLGLYFLGPLGVGVLLAALGRRVAPVMVAASAVLLQVLLGLLHGDTGIHVVGPIHYSECVVPLTVLFAWGVPKLLELAGRFRDGTVGPQPLLLAGLVLLTGQIAALAVEARLLQDQARIHRLFYDAVADLPPAVVLSDPPWRIWELRPEIAAVGTWIADLPHPDPYFRDRVLWALEGRADLGLLRQRFPQRRFYRLSLAAEGQPWRLEELAPQRGGEKPTGP